MTSAAEMAAVAKQAEDFIVSSVKLAYNRVGLYRSPEVMLSFWRYTFATFTNVLAKILIPSMVVYVGIA